MFIFCLNCGAFQHARAELTLDNLPETDILNQLEKKYQTRIRTDKKEQEDTNTEKIKRAKEILASKKIPLTTKDFIQNALKNNVETVNLMLDAGMDVNASYYGQYALFYATKYNAAETALLLLSKGANPALGFDSPLWWSVKHNNFYLTQELVKQGANPNSVDIVSSQSVLYLAVKKKHFDIARFLIESGAKIDNQTGYLIQKNKLQQTLGIYFKEN